MDISPHLFKEFIERADRLYRGGSISKKAASKTFRLFYEQYKTLRDADENPPSHLNSQPKVT